MSRPADLPSQTHARDAWDQYRANCATNGRRPSVLGLAAHLGLTNTTFRRHFPDLGHEISTARTTAVAPTAADGLSGAYDSLVARNAKLRRTNRTLTDQLRLAAAHIQRLSIDNARLRNAVEASSNITRIDRPDRPRHR